MAALDTISKAEAIKQQSRQLRGNLARDLADTAHPFDKTGYSLLKFHGIYQGYARDSATERKQRGGARRRCCRRPAPMRRAGAPARTGGVRWSRVRRTASESCRANSRVAARARGTTRPTA